MALFNCIDCIFTDEMFEFVPFLIAVAGCIIFQRWRDMFLVAALVVISVVVGELMMMTRMAYALPTAFKHETPLDYITGMSMGYLFALMCVFLAYGIKLIIIECARRMFAASAPINSQQTRSVPKN